MNNYYWIIGIVIIVFVIAIFFQQNSQPIACTQEAKICPDGSAVGRVAPNCDFAPCPSEINCSLFSADNCPSLCVVCPPCEVCSSISCQTEEFCKSIGFDRSWWESVRPKNICKCPEGYILEGDVCNPRCYYSTPKCLAPSIMCNATNNQTTDELCTASGGTVTNRLCCKSADDFPNTCLIGACGCSPDNSKEIKVCDCGEGKCWDSTKQACVTQ
jgi:hypothetical protein